MPASKGGENGNSLDEVIFPLEMVPASLLAEAALKLFAR